ncbi:MAG: hypothetical protein HFF39_01105 [Lawsonibacter sp.]|nr:hypothetical protein [Lawsonibacter sp.]
MAQQGAALSQAVCLGLALGLLYDLFRILRVRLKLPLLGGILDFSFWLAVTAVLFLWSQGAWGGRVRLYGILFLFSGGVLYFWGFSPWMLKIGYFFADLADLFWKIVTFPLALLKNLWKKVKKTSKKIFHSGLKWYRINQITEELEAARRRRTIRERGGRANALQKNRSDYKNHRAGSHGVHGLRSAESPRTNPERSGPKEPPVRPGGQTEDG